MTVFARRIGAIAGVVVVGLLLSGCVAGTGATPDPDASLDDVCSDPIVVECETYGDPALVVIRDDEPDADVRALAEQLSALAAAGAITLRAESSDPRILDAEVSPPTAWELTIAPGETDDVAPTLDGILAAAAATGAVGIGVYDGWPYVTVQSLDQFEDVFTSVSATPLFAGGGTYTLQSLDEHLRIVHVPTRTTDAAILEIIAIARDYPEAEVLLEAPTAGPQYPALYVSRLTPEQVTELSARLDDPRLATADVDGYAVDYTLGSLGPDGTTYVGGTFGAVPSS